LPPKGEIRALLAAPLRLRRTDPVPSRVSEPILAVVWTPVPAVVAESVWRPTSSPWHPTRGQTDAAATLLADVLADGLRPTIADRVADRVVDYPGWSGRWRLRTRRWNGADCRLLAQTAKAVLDLKRKLHDVTGEAVSRLLPPDTPRFHRMLVKKIAAKVPLPPDIKLEAIARGLQIIGIFMCIVGNVPLERCACLRMLGPQLIKEQIKRYVEDLLEETKRDLKGVA
jgi:hypothetical protein